MTGVSVAMLWIPIMVLKCLQSIYVNGLVSGVDIKKFMDDFNAQAKAQTTMASIIMAVDASILAIPGLGSQLATKVYYMQGKMINLQAILLSITAPTMENLPDSSICFEFILPLSLLLCDLDLIIPSKEYSGMMFPHLAPTHHHNFSDPHFNNCLGYHFNAAKHVKSLAWRSGMQLAIFRCPAACVIVALQASSPLGLSFFLLERVESL
ncbi:hypothetical protein EV424DRAFT_1349348 [Suillus variegatus]|nr:hypothetical protein EV424DRAFT_1349348 [Suillus variegatus]